MIKIFLCDDEAAILNRIKELIEKERQTLANELEMLKNLEG